MADARGPGRELAVGALAVSALMGIGIGGYVWIDGVRPFDALYQTFLTLTTIGFNEAWPLSDGARVFTMAIATVGIGTFAWLATRAVQIIVATASFRTRRMQRRIDSLSGHYVVCGYGRVGQHVAAVLRAAGREVVVVDRADEVTAQLGADGVLYVQDDAVEEHALRAAGLARAAGLVLVLPEDAANVFVALTAREIRSESGLDGLFIVSRTNEPSSVNKLRRAGVDKVISPIEIGADRIVQTILQPRVDRFMEQVVGDAAMDFDLEEIPVTAGSPLDGRSLTEVGFRARYNAIVVGVLTASGEWRFNPDAGAPLHAGDTLIVLGSAAKIGEIRSAG